MARDELVAAVYRCLERCGTATRAEIAASAGRHTSKIGSVLHRMNAPGVRLRKRIHIVDYVYDDEDGGRRYPRAAYALGDKPDVRKPRPEPNAAQARRYRATRNARVVSIFALAQGASVPSKVCL